MFLLDHIPLSPEAATCVYVTGYCIFKYGQRDVFCIDCYNKLVTLSSNARYLRLIKHLGEFLNYTNIYLIQYNISIIYFPVKDRGELKYPGESTAARMWNVQCFFNRVFSGDKK